MKPEIVESKNRKLSDWPKVQAMSEGDVFLLLLDRTGENLLLDFMFIVKGSQMKLVDWSQPPLSNVRGLKYPSLINSTFCPMIHWACESICHQANIGTGLSSGEGDGFNPADEKQYV